MRWSNPFKNPTSALATAIGGGYILLSVGVVEFFGGFTEFEAFFQKAGRWPGTGLVVLMWSILGYAFVMSAVLWKRRHIHAWAWNQDHVALRLMWVDFDRLSDLRSFRFGLVITNNCGRR